MSNKKTKLPTASLHSKSSALEETDNQRFTLVTEPHSLTELLAIDLYTSLLSIDTIAVLAAVRTNNHKVAHVSSPD